MKSSLIYIRFIGIVLAAAIVLISIFSQAQLIGFADGAKWGNHPASVIINTQVKLSTGIGPSAYDLFILAYIVIAVCLGAYIILNLFWKGNIVTGALSIVTILVALYKYYFLFEWKARYLELNPEVGLYYWIMKTTPYDWFSVISLTVLIVIQVLTVFVSFRRSKNERNLVS